MQEGTAQDTREKTGAVAEAAKEQARSVAHDAKEEARSVAHDAKDQARSVAQHPLSRSQCARGAAVGNASRAKRDRPASGAPGSATRCWHGRCNGVPCRTATFNTWRPI